MIGIAAKVCIPKLTRGLKDYKKHSDEHFMVRQQAAWTTGRMGPLAKEHIDLLISMMHGEGQKAPEIVEAIGRIGVVHENVVPNILDFMERGSAWTMIQTWKTLQKFGTKSERAIPFTKRFLTKPSFYGKSDGRRRELIVIEAMKLLQVVGPKAVDALPPVKSLINYKYPFNEDDDVTPLMRKEAAKTADILKSIAAKGKVTPNEKQ